MKKGRILVLASLLVVIGLLAGGFGCKAPTTTPSPIPSPAPKPSPSLSPTTTPGAPPTPKPTAPATPTPTAPVAPKPTGTFTIALSSFMGEVLDPSLGTVGVATTLGGPIFDSLLGVTDDGQPKPGIAKSWDISSDGLIITFHLMKGVKFHNGDELTAEDVKFSIERFMSDASRSSFKSLLKEKITSVEVPDPYTFVIHSKGPWPTVAYAFSPVEAQEGMIMPKKYIEKVGWAQFARNPIGSGPWKFSKQQLGSFVEYEANEEHWEIVPRFKTLRLVQIPEESTRLAALQSGEADLAEISPSGKKAASAAGLRIKSIQATANPMIMLWIQEGHPELNGPIDDVRVRQALAFSINRQEIIDTLYNGEAILAAFHGMTPGTLGYDPNYKGYPYDLEKAKQLMKDAGFANGFSMNIYGIPLAGSPELPKLAEIVAGYWDRIGVKAKIIPMDWATFSPLLKVGKDAPDPKVTGAANSFRASRRPSYVSTMAAHFTQGGSTGLFRNPKLQEIVNKATSQLTMEKAAEIIQKEFIPYVAPQYRSIPIAHSNTVYALGPRVGSIQLPLGYPGVTRQAATATIAK